MFPEQMPQHDIENIARMMVDEADEVFLCDQCADIRKANMRHARRWRKALWFMGAQMAVIVALLVVVGWRFSL